MVPGGARWADWPLASGSLSGEHGSRLTRRSEQSQQEACEAPNPGALCRRPAALGLGAQPPGALAAAVNKEPHHLAVRSPPTPCLEDPLPLAWGQCSVWTGFSAGPVRPLMGGAVAEVSPQIHVKS